MGVLRVEVKDSGVGISAENQGRLFGEFAQFNRNKLQGGGWQYIRLFWLHHIANLRYFILWSGGSGLGLWISRRIIHMHKVGIVGVIIDITTGISCDIYIFL